MTTEIVITRDILNPDFTLGKIEIDSEPFGYSVEDSVRDVKIHGKTAIPYGR